MIWHTTDSLLDRAYGRLPQNYLAVKPRLIRSEGVWFCAIDLMLYHGLFERRSGPLAKGLTPRIAYDAWAREMRR